MKIKFRTWKKNSFPLVLIVTLAALLIKTATSCFPDSYTADASRIMSNADCPFIPISDTVNRWYFGDISFSSGRPYSPPGSVYRFYKNLRLFKMNRMEKKRAFFPVDLSIIDFRMSNHWSNWGTRSTLTAGDYLITGAKAGVWNDTCHGFIQIDSTDAPTPPAALHLVLDSLRDFAPATGNSGKFKKWQVAKIMDVDSQDVSQSASWACYADNRYSFFKGGKCEIETGALACDQEGPNTSRFTNYQVTSEFSNHQNPGRIQLKTYIPGTNVPVNFEVLESRFQQVKLMAQNEQGEKAVLYLTPSADQNPQTPKIGKYHEGGVVFYVARKPTDLDGDGNPDKGLVCAVKDQGSDIEWGCIGALMRANGKQIGTGAYNTRKILANCSDKEAFAAKICDDYSGGGYNDWFLPSIQELEYMYFNRAIIDSTSEANGGNSFKSSEYWSSTESDYNEAWYFFFWNISNIDDRQRSSKHFVRAIRAF
ncbi:MAG: DUF1566 domain-containing protein [Schleiferiaceae bacterium]|nr:DUF1566 domain-containing protein [Schleiferiaceae bacterium]